MSISNYSIHAIKMLTSLPRPSNNLQKRGELKINEQIYREKRITCSTSKFTSINISFMNFLDSTEEKKYSLFTNAYSSVFLPTSAYANIKIYQHFTPLTLVFQYPRIESLTNNCNITCHTFDF